MGDWRRLVGRPVVVTASGVEYRGVVVELGEHALMLRTPSGHLEIPWERVTSLAEDEGGKAGRLES